MTATDTDGRPVIEPTDVPAELEERAYRVFDWTTERSATTYRYVKPMTEHGPPDYELMIDLMGLAEPGTIWRYHDATYVTARTFDTTTQWGETFDTVGLEACRWPTGRYGTPGETVRFRPGDGLSTLSLWKSYIHGDVEVIGNIHDL